MPRRAGTILQVDVSRAIRAAKRNCADTERRGPLDSGIARLVDGIALTLAAEHHALEVAQGLPRLSEMGSDGLFSPRAS
jgi:hypothetical protein